MSSLQIEKLITSGLLYHEGASFAIENNVWLAGNDEEVLVIDAAHNAAAIEEAVRGRNVLGIFLTHGHQDHINAAVETAGLLDAQIFLHPADMFLWREMYETDPDVEIEDGMEFLVAGSDFQVRHTPGHTPGSVCLVSESDNLIFSGDTLFEGGPGATRWDYSSFPQIISSIQERIFTLPRDLDVHPGHGASTTVIAEKANIEAYIARGW